MSVDTLLDDMRQHFRSRKFIAGLMLAMIDFIVALEVPADVDINGYEGLIEKFPRQELTAQGKQANTLIVKKKDAGTISLRPFYNEAERLFRAVYGRFDYPNCAPHATQAWAGYVHWLDELCRLDSSELGRLRNSVVEFVLSELPDQSFIPGSILVASPAFKLLLEGFEFASPPGEPSGAAFQGAVFGFIRADNPHLQVEIDKVRTGSSRRQRVGDIDGWDGERLAITAEVKSMNVAEEIVPDLAGFANKANMRGAIGLVVALSFSGETRAMISDQGMICLDKNDLTGIVRLWDPAKQRIAVESVIYYAAHVEKNSVLLSRLKAFVANVS